MTKKFGKLPKADPEGQKRVRQVTGKKPSAETARRADRDRTKKDQQQERQRRSELNQVKSGVVRPHPDSKRGNSTGKG